MRLQNKYLRFVWRASRNLLCIPAISRQLLFPQDKLTAYFGRGDADYSWHVFLHHHKFLRDAGFIFADHILEVGPGKNLGTALLWWAYCRYAQDKSVEVVCWDVFKNASPEKHGYWEKLAGELIAAQPVITDGPLSVEIERLLSQLHDVVGGQSQPQIDYRVQSLSKFKNSMARGGGFDLIYSHAAIEHIWHVERFWETIVGLTRVGGWHNHTIDLADHGYRDTNYIEMLEWSALSYWLTMRFVPGAINRWRAGQHLRKLEELGLKTLAVQREMRAHLPVPSGRIAREFRTLDDEELRTTTLDVVGVLP